MEQEQARALYGAQAPRPLPGLKVRGTGSYIPPLSVSNDMMTQIVDTSDQWIVSRTGIKTRHFAAEEDHRQMAAIAAQRAMADAGVAPEDIALVICAVITGDYHTPSLACLLQRDLKLPERIFAFDVNGACSGFVYSLNLAHALLPASPGKYALVVGSEILSRITDFSDRATCVLFGDGAGAAVLGLDHAAPFYFVGGCQGDDQSLVCRAAYAAENPFAPAAKAEAHPYIRMNGSEVYRFAVESFYKCVQELLRLTEKRAADIDHYLCHQANYRIISASAKKLGLGMERFFLNIESRGNTSAASVAIALDELWHSGSLQRGQSMILAGFGGGLTYGAAYLIW